MRDIRFRAWFPQTKRMTETFRLGQLIEQIENTRKEEDGIYLQFIGLKDKNGKEIYEGDIVKWDDEYCSAIKSQVIYSWGYWYPLIKVEYGKNCIDNYDPGDFEIIGNAYENPELLEVEKE